MLVFSRKRNEAIIIGDGIEVRVLRVGRDGVRLGIKAPQQVSVHRQEVYEEIRQANERAAGGGPAPEGWMASLRRRVFERSAADGNGR